jgi:Flp pilus assembly protein TadB
MIALAVICVIFILIAWNMVKYSQKIKESERHNNRVLEDLKKEKSKVKRGPKVSEDQVSNKRKYRSAKKKAVESKVKKNAGRNKKKV